MPAQTFAGMMAKLALAAADFADVDLTRCGGSSEDILASVAVDFNSPASRGQVRSMAQGIKTGGRKRGSLNKKTILRAKTAENQGLSPLEFLLSVVRDQTKDIAVRLDAAKCAAPYLHARLQTTAVQSGPIHITVAPEDLAL